MTFALLTLLASLGVAAVTEWFSVVGIMAIYAGATHNSALIMGLVLGGAKLVTISWLYRNWKFASWTLRAPLIYFTIALMAASSIGVYGFLTKAHLEQGAATVDNSAKVERLDQQISREKSVIADNEKVMGQLDTAINSYLGNDKTDRALSVRRAQAPQRKQLKDEIAMAQKAIDGFSDEKLKLTSEVRAMQLEVGPIKYIADLFYGSDVNATTKIESAVRIFTLLIVSTLDPLAVILLIAANHTILRIQNEEKEKAAQELTKDRNIINGDQPAQNDPGKVTNEIYIAKDEPTEAPVEKINIEAFEGHSNEDKIVVRSIIVDPEMDAAIPASESIESDIIDNTTTVELAVEQITLPEIIINEEQAVDLEEVEYADKPIEDTENTPDVDNRSLDETIESATATATAAATAAEILQIQEAIVKKQPWANQPGVLNEFIGNSAHFIPQAIDEKSKKTELANRIKEGIAAAGNRIEDAINKASTQEIEAMAEVGPGQIQEENGTQTSEIISVDIGNSNSKAVANDKYPKALSWLTEFKGV